MISLDFLDYVLRDYIPVSKSIQLIVKFVKTNNHI